MRVQSTKFCFFVICSTILLYCDIHAQSVVKMSVDLTSESNVYEYDRVEVKCSVYGLNKTTDFVSIKQESDTGVKTEWVRNGSLFSSRTDGNPDIDVEQLEGGAIYKLIFQSTIRTNAGNYSCYAIRCGKNPPCSVLKSKTVDVNILYFPTEVFPVCSHDQDNNTLTFGRRVHFTCRSEEGFPAVSLNWLGLSEGSLKDETKTIDESKINTLEVYASREINGTSLTCILLSPAFQNMNRSCTLGPFEVVDSNLDDDSYHTNVENDDNSIDKMDDVDDVTDVMDDVDDDKNIIDDIDDSTDIMDDIKDNDDSKDTTYSQYILIIAIAAPLIGLTCLILLVACMYARCGEEGQDQDTVMTPSGEDVLGRHDTAIPKGEGYKELVGELVQYMSFNIFEGVKMFLTSVKKIVFFSISLYLLLSSNSTTDLLNVHRLNAD